MSETEKLQAAIDLFQGVIDFCDDDEKTGMSEYHKLAIAALKDQQSRMCPKPMTKEELQEIADKDDSLGSHIWVKDLRHNQLIAAITDITNEGVVAVYCANQKSQSVDGLGYFIEKDYGVTWLAYATEPEGERE